MLIRLGTLYLSFIRILHFSIFVLNIHCIAIFIRLTLLCFWPKWQLVKMFITLFLQMITLGGDAELELVDSLDPFSEGVVFSVRPPKKSWKNIANLSGGEKVLYII